MPRAWLSAKAGPDIAIFLFAVYVYLIVFFVTGAALSDQWHSRRHPIGEPDTVCCAVALVTDTSAACPQTLTAAFRQHDTDMDGVITIQYEQFLSMVLSLKL